MSFKGSVSRSGRAKVTSLVLLPGHQGPKLRDLELPGGIDRRQGCLLILRTYKVPPPPKKRLLDPLLCHKGQHLGYFGAKLEGSKTQGLLFRLLWSSRYIFECKERGARCSDATGAGENGKSLA